MCTGRCNKKAPVFAGASDVSLFPTLALSRSGILSLFSGLYYETTPVKKLPMVIPKISCQFSSPNKGGDTACKHIHRSIRFPFLAAMVEMITRTVVKVCNLPAIPIKDTYEILHFIVHTDFRHGQSKHRTKKNGKRFQGTGKQVILS